MMLTREELAVRYQDHAAYAFWLAQCARHTLERYAGYGGYEVALALRDIIDHMEEAAVMSRCARVLMGIEE